MKKTVLGYFLLAVVAFLPLAHVSLAQAGDVLSLKE
jgi:hypothetical protein